MRSFVILGLALALIVVVLALRSGAPSTRRPLDVPSVATRTPASAVDDATMRGVSIAPEQREVAATPAEESEASVPAEPVAAAPSAEFCVFGGSAVRVDPDGQEHASDDGAFVMFWRRGAEFESRQVEVVGGSWSVSVPMGVELSVRELILADVLLTVEDDSFALPSDRFMVLVGREQQSVLLHVVSEGGVELDGVEVWSGPYDFPSDMQHPGSSLEGEPLLSSERSPVSIPPNPDAWRTETQYFVRATGHAWGTIAIDHAAKGERTLELAPACGLEVELVGSADWLEPEIRLWPPDAPTYATYAFSKVEPDADDRGVFEDLPPGEYVVSVERGWGDERVSYGTAAIALVAGDRAHVTVEVELPERPDVVLVEGTLTLPDAWGLDSVELKVGAEGDTRVWMPRDTSLLVGGSWGESGEATKADDGRRFQWRVELPAAGTYRVEAWSLHVRELLRVPEEGLAGVELVVPPPADVIVTVIDDATGDRIAVESLYWSGPAVEGILGTSLESVVADATTGLVRFRARAGEIELSPKDPSLVPVDLESAHTIVPGENRIELRVRRQIGVRFTFMDGDAEVPFDWSWRLGARQVDGDARDVSRSIGVLWFREPGLYALRSEGIPGYSEVDGTTFDVFATDGPMREVVVRLTRD